MKDWKNIFKAVIAAASTFISFLLGDWDMALQALIVMVVLDYFSGIADAFINKTLNSQTGLKGIIKKLLYFVLVAVGLECDRLFGSVNLIRNFVIYYLVANEGLSILENIANCEIKIPEKLREALEQLKDKEDQKGENEE